MVTWLNRRGRDLKSALHVSQDRRKSQHPTANTQQLVYNFIVHKSQMFTNANNVTNHNAISICICSNDDNCAKSPFHETDDFPCIQCVPWLFSNCPTEDQSDQRDQRAGWIWEAVKGPEQKRIAVNAALC